MKRCLKALGKTDRKKEGNVINRWYGPIYETSGKPKQQQKLFVGKSCHRFKEGVEEPVTRLEPDSLEPLVGGTTILRSVPPNLQSDIGLFDLHNIIAVKDVKPAMECMECTWVFSVIISTHESCQNGQTGFF